VTVDITTAAELTAPATTATELTAPATRPGLAEIVARRTLDIGVAAVVLLLMAPVIAVVALTVRLSSPGPVFFRQRRLGRNMRPFTVLKFRTMRADADSALHRDYVRSLIGTEPPANPRNNLYKLVVDPRVTSVGRFLRSWSLDELPQLWNVLRGDMSLVGPRPVIEYEVEQYPDWYLRRFAVKPGMTGLWQVSGRNERTYEEMVRFDVEYAERRSLWMDLRILARTAIVVMRRQGVA
jgi:lipopolysaccharide/colanic/teichoic acid biosynthesis glycosyltransferase